MEGRDGNRAARSTDKAVSTNVSPRAPSQALGLSAAFTAAVRRPHHWGRIRELGHSAPGHLNVPYPPL